MRGLQLNDVMKAARRASGPYWAIEKRSQLHTLVYGLLIISVSFFLQLRTVDDLEYSVETTKGKRPHRGGLFPVSTRSSAGVSVRKVHYSSPRLIEVETWK